MALRNTRASIFWQDLSWRGNGVGDAGRPSGRRPRKRPETPRPSCACSESTMFLSVADRTAQLHRHSARTGRMISGTHGAGLGAGLVSSGLARRQVQPVCHPLAANCATFCMPFTFGISRPALLSNSAASLSAESNIFLIMAERPGQGFRV